MNKEFLEAFFNLKRDIEPLKKNAKNPFFKKKYADLNAILTLLNPELEKYKFIFFQTVQISELYVNKVSIISNSSRAENKTEKSNQPLYKLLTTLIHIPTEEKIENIYPILVSSIDSQSFGSAITYARRYALQNLFSLTASDDDGEMTTNHNPVTYPKNISKENLIGKLLNIQNIDELEKIWIENKKGFLNFSKKDQDEITEVKNTLKNDLQKI